MDLCTKGEEVAMAAFVGPPLRTRKDTIKEIQDASDRITTIQNIIETAKVENPALKKKRDQYIKIFLRLRQNYIANYYNPLPTHKPDAWRDEMPDLAVRNILKFLTLEEIRKYKEAGMLSDSALYMASPVIHSKCEEEAEDFLKKKTVAGNAHFVKKFCTEGENHYEICEHLQELCNKEDPYGFKAKYLKAWDVLREFVQRIPEKMVEDDNKYFYQDPPDGSTETEIKQFKAEKQKYEKIRSKKEKEFSAKIHEIQQDIEQSPVGDEIMRNTIQKIGRILRFTSFKDVKKYIEDYSPYNDEAPSWNTYNPPSTTLETLGF